MKAARAAGWRRRDLWWERLTEAALADLAEGRRRRGLARLRRAWRLAQVSFPWDDPRRATSLANAAYADRVAGREARAARRYAEARARWRAAAKTLDALTIRPKARSSLFHLRMEVKHWDTYQANMKARLAKFIQETDEALTAFTQNTPSPHRLAARWRGEKPAIFDDARKLLAACLLLAQ